MATLTGTQILLLVVSETGIVCKFWREAHVGMRFFFVRGTDRQNCPCPDTFTTSKFQPMVGPMEDGSPSEGQKLIQACLVSPGQVYNSEIINC